MPAWKVVRSLPFAVVVAAVALALRKPWALHTPQLWAEDGSIFLTQDDQWGTGAILAAYNGYLHLLPRLIAFTARHVADVAWWPAIYNGIAYAVTIGLFVRLASPRLELPVAIKPWLILALPLVVGTGEVLINVTNLQWVTALFLIAQLMMRPPSGVGQRVRDLTLLVIVGLNGPFAIVLAPLFALRWLNHCTSPNESQTYLSGLFTAPGRDHLLAFLAILGCAVVQAVCLWRAGAPLDIEGKTAPFVPQMFLTLLGTRLVTWPMFGPAMVRAWPNAVHAALGIAFIGLVLAYSVRGDSPARPARRMLAGAFALLTAACAFRLRADTWTEENIVNGDRYFYLSRVLLTWLLIFQCYSTHPWRARLAGGLCAMSLAFHLPHFVIPAPPDYRWAEHCEPIRRGVPANIKTLPEGWWIEYPGRTKH